MKQRFKCQLCGAPPSAQGCAVEGSKPSLWRTASAQGVRRDICRGCGHDFYCACTTPPRSCDFRNCDGNIVLILPAFNRQDKACAAHLDDMIRGLILMKEQFPNMYRLRYPGGLKPQWLADKPMPKELFLLLVVQ